MDSNQENVIVEDTIFFESNAELFELNRIVEESLEETRGIRRSCPEGQEESVSKKQRIEPPKKYDPIRLLLRTGETIYFQEGEPTNILLTPELEPNIVIRKVISKVPKEISKRLDFLFKFVNKVPSYLLEEDDDTEQNYDILRDQVLTAYMKEYKLRFIFRKALHRWRIHKMNKNSEQEVDPITLCEPEKPVVLYDWNNKKKFVFEASTLALMIESNLMYQERGFAMPIQPKSPANNVEFSYSQLISIYYQLKSHGELIWALPTFRHCNFNKKKWYKYHKSAITVSAIKTSITLLDSYDAIELLSDFIFSRMDQLRFQVSRFVSESYLAGMRSVPRHWYLEKWKYLAMIHFEGEHFDEDRTQYINACSFKLFRKQTQFFNELRALNIIR